MLVYKLKMEAPWRAIRLSLKHIALTFMTLQGLAPPGMHLIVAYRILHAGQLWGPTQFVLHAKLVLTTLVCAGNYRTLVTGKNSNG